MHAAPIHGTIQGATLRHVMMEAYQDATLQTIIPSVPHNRNFFFILNNSDRFFTHITCSGVRSTYFASSGVPPVSEDIILKSFF